MSWFYNHSIEVQVALITLLIAGIGALFTVLQYFKRSHHKAKTTQSVAGDNNKSVQVGGDSQGDINIK
ncbi:hypothetical protein [Pseudoalteromonas byunsanensis]|uniref:Uncharacterized protein n=1 Tax=Pseudoalteromonas byunsanensis TaxID=327939 RepID=A0A1S1N6H9_9GAMM|nr:hypothetical protein [Pseudoalteromonas byunsanensis]OHU94932.1 hypothetical protein BIW53_13005 [Pseudoalteromonas byunsanensis]